MPHFFIPKFQTRLAQNRLEGNYITYEYDNFYSNNDYHTEINVIKIITNPRRKKRPTAACGKTESIRNL